MKICTALLLLSLVAAAVAEENQIVNPEFKTGSNGAASGWDTPFEPERRSVWSFDDGVLTLREDAKKYTTAAASVVPVDGFKSYRIEVEVKTENLAKPAGVYYYWLDKDGKAISPERFVARLKESGDFRKVAAVVSPEDPVRTAKLKLCLSVYHQPDGKGRVCFRRPGVFQAEKAGNPVKKAEKKAKPSVSSGLDFSLHQLTYRNRGETTFIEKGSPGFLSLHSRTSPAGPVTLRLSAPAGVSAELYYCDRRGVARRIEPKTPGVFEIPRETEHRAWGNSLIFGAGPDVPENFTMKVEFLSGSRILDFYTIPVRQLPAEKVELPRKFKLCSWYGYPIARIHEYWKQPLASALFRNWCNTGFAGAQQPTPESDWSHYVAYTHVLSHWHEDAPGMPSVLSAGGIPGKLICPSALIRGGKAFFLSEIDRKNARQAIASGPVRVVVDYEPYAGNEGWVTGHCFCPECREAFRQYAHLDKVPDAKTILTKQEEQWVKFRCLQRAQVTRAMAEAVHAVNPQARFALCSMPMPEGRGDVEYRYLKAYGIDLRLHDPYIDEHMPMNYDPGMNFYRRLERNDELRKPVVMVLDNGWGSSRSDAYPPEKLRAQTFASAFCGIGEIYWGAGLLRMDGSVLRNLKLAMNDAAALEKLKQGTAVPFKTVLPESVWLKQRGNLALLVNNSPHAEKFATITPELGASISEPLKQLVWSPDGTKRSWAKGTSATVKLAPLEYKLLQIGTPDSIPADWKLQDNSSMETERRAKEAREAAMAAPQKMYGMSGALKGESYEVTTPVQTLSVSLNSGASAKWLVNGKPVAEAAATDSFVLPEPLALKDLPARFAGIRFRPDRVEATFEMKLRQAAYDGLLIRKTFLAMRNEPVITVNLEIVPENGYRPFRFRTAHVLSFDRKDFREPYSKLIGYRIPEGGNIVDDRHGDHRIYTRSGVTPVMGKYGPNARFEGDSCEAYHEKSGNALRCEFSGVGELFFWRRGDSATVETIWFDAYPDNDPHKIKTWRTSYTLRYLPGKNVTK